MFTPEQAESAMKLVQKFLAMTDLSESDRLEAIFRHLAAYRAILMAHKTLGTIGPIVYGGPFKGMKLEPEALQGIFAPNLLGIYEQELHPTVERAIATPYQCVLNIGCSVGYYAVGLALRMPNTQIHAFDIDAYARQRCARHANFNGVQDRVTIGEEFKGEDFARYENMKTLLVMDIEAAEETLLDPAAYPAIRKMDVIVELHEVMKPGIADTVMKRFAATHDLELIPNKPIMFDIDRIIGKYAYMDAQDIFLLGWENRSGATPWGVFRVKA